MCYHPLVIPNPLLRKGDSVMTSRTNQPRYVSVPCGKCQECLINEQLRDAFRFDSEAYYHRGFVFTLSYPDFSLPEFGVNREHISSFLKKLKRNINIHLGFNKHSERDKWNCFFVYHITAEYGSEKNRPHYHGLIFVDDSLDKEFCMNLIFRCWCDVIGDNWFTYDFQDYEIGRSGAAYVAKWHLEKGNKPSPLLNDTFHVSSRRFIFGDRFIKDPKVLDSIRVHKDGKIETPDSRFEHIRLTRRMSDSLLSFGQRMHRKYSVFREMDLTKDIDAEKVKMADRYKMYQDCINKNRNKKY